LPPSKKPEPAANVKPTVTGVFKGNGKDAKLAYVSAHWREPFSDKPSIVLVFTEKDHSKDKKPDFNAGFGKFGSALIVSLHEDGDIFGCEVAHSALKHQNFSSIGKINTNDFEYADGQVKGELATEGPADVFGETGGECKARAARRNSEGVSACGVERGGKPRAPSLARRRAKDSDDEDDDNDDAAAKPKSAGLNMIWRSQKMHPTSIIQSAR
jgi:hypothetical protein